MRKQGLQMSDLKLLKGLIMKTCGAPNELFRAANEGLKQRREAHLPMMERREAHLAHFDVLVQLLPTSERVD